MHPRLLTTFSTGRSSKTEAAAEGTHKDLSAEPLYELGLPVLPIGAGQAASPDTAAPAIGGVSVQPPLPTAMLPPKQSAVPVGVAVNRPIPRPGRAGGGSTLKTLQLWEGTVTEANCDGFVATLKDKTNSDNPDEQVVFGLDEISEDDRQFVCAGSTFYWVIGAERTRGGQLRNVSVVQFRRVPAWTRGALAQAGERARKLRDVFRSDL